MPSSKSFLALANSGSVRSPFFFISASSFSWPKIPPPLLLLLLRHRSSSSTAAPAPRGHHKPERIGHYELLPRRLGNPTTGACPCRSARTRATPAAAAPARQRASKRHAGWLSRVWAVLRGTVRRGTQPRPHTHTHAHSYQPVCIINTYYLTYPTPHTRDARLGRR